MGAGVVGIGLDHRLMELAAALEPDDKVHGLVTKRIFKDALRAAEDVAIALAGAAHGRMSAREQHVPARLRRDARAFAESSRP